MVRRLILHFRLIECNNYDSAGPSSGQSLHVFKAILIQDCANIVPPKIMLIIIILGSWLEYILIWLGGRCSWIVRRNAYNKYIVPVLEKFGCQNSQ